MQPDSISLWSLYLLRASNNILYTGVTTDVSRRMAEHENRGAKNKGAKALRGKAPLQLVYNLCVGSRSEALKLEYRVKQLTRAQKEELIGLPAELEELVGWLNDR